MLEVEKAVILQDYSILVTFNDGKTKIFDMGKMLKYPVFSKLRDGAVFRDFTIRHGVMTWDDGNIDIAPEFMYYHDVDETGKVRAEENPAQKNNGLVPVRWVNNNWIGHTGWNRTPGWLRVKRYPFLYLVILEGLESAVKGLRDGTVRRQVRTLGDEDGTEGC